MQNMSNRWGASRLIAALTGLMAATATTRDKAAIEREVVRLSHVSTVNAVLIRYLNRLSDLLFVMARVANHRAGVPDTVWGEPGWRRKRQAGETQP